MARFYRTILFFPVIAFVLPGHTAAFEYSGYKWDDSELPLVYKINPANMPAYISTETFITVVQRGFQTWNDVSCSDMAFSYGGLTEGVGTRDDVHAIFWNPNGDGLGNALAITRQWTNFKGDRLLDADMELNGSQPWSLTDVVQQNKYDLLAVITHEAGNSSFTIEVKDLMGTGLSRVFTIEVRSVNQPDIFGMEIGNRWTSRGAMYEKVEEFASLDKTTFPVVTHLLETRKNGILDSRAWYEKTGDLLLEAFKVRYAFRIWNSAYHQTDTFYQWRVPYLGSVKYVDNDSQELLTCFIIGGGSITTMTDVDGDGLKDYEELVLSGTYWQESDTDGDGRRDGAEVLGGRNPNAADPQGDINGDCRIDLKDVITALQVQRDVSAVNGIDRPEM
jgi:hypothetical protein